MEENTSHPVGAVTFVAHFARASTQADGAIRISLDISTSEAQAFVDLMKYQKRRLQVAILPLPMEERLARF